MSIDPVTARWTEAFFGLARRQGVLDAVTADVERLAADVVRPDVRDALFDPRADRPTQAGAIEGLCEGLSPLTANLVRLLFSRRREDVLLGLGEAFRRRSLAERGAVEGVVESARPIATPDLAALAASLQARLGKEVVLENRVDPDLVGGIRVLADNKMIDYSVQGRLTSLGRRLHGARLPASTATSGA